MLNGTRDGHIKWSKSERERQISYINAYMWNLEKWYRWTYLQSKKRHRCREQKSGYQGGKRAWDRLGDWNWHLYVLCLVAQSCPTLCSMHCSQPGCSIHGDSPGKNTRVGCHALLQGIFPTRGLNPGRSPTLQADSLPSKLPGKPVCVCVCVYIYIYKDICRYI